MTKAEMENEKWWEEFDLATMPSVPRLGNIYMNDKCVVLNIEDYRLYMKAKQEVIEERNAWRSRRNQIERANANIAEALEYIGAAMARMALANQVSPDKKD